MNCSGIDFVDTGVEWVGEVLFIVFVIGFDGNDLAATVIFDRGVSSLTRGGPLIIRGGSLV
jgi:hypothetical protein